MNEKSKGINPRSAVSEKTIKSMCSMLRQCRYWTSMRITRSFWVKMQTALNWIHRGKCWASGRCSCSENHGRRLKNTSSTRSDCEARDHPCRSPSWTSRSWSRRSSQATTPNTSHGSFEATPRSYRTATVTQSCTAQKVICIRKRCRRVQRNSSRISTRTAGTVR